MEDWFKEVGRPALFDALAGVCDRIDNELGISLESHADENARLSAELASAKSRVSDVDRLEEENRSLRRELENLNNASHANTSNTRIPLGPKSANQVLNPKRSTKPGGLELDKVKLSELKEEYSKLQGNFTKLHGKYSELESAHAKLNKVLHDLKDGYLQWKDHATRVDEISKRRSQTIKRLKAKLAAAAAAASDPFDTSFSSDIPTRPASRQQMAAPELVELDDPNEFGSIRPDPIPTEDPLAWPPLDIGASGRGTTINRTSLRLMGTFNGSRLGERRDNSPGSETNSTHDAGDTPTLPPLPRNRDPDATSVRIKEEPSSDAPVVMSERRVRKRKHDDNQTDAPQAPAIKMENGSDPLITDERHNFVPHESIDFDAEGITVQTPRKRNRPNQPENRFISGPPRNPPVWVNDTQSPERSRPSTRLPWVPSPEPPEVPRNQPLALDPPGRNDRLQQRAPTFSKRPQLRIDPPVDSDYDLDLNQRELRPDKGPSKISRSHSNSKTSSKTPASRNTTPKQGSTEKTTHGEAGDTIPLRERPKSELSITDFKVNPAVNDGYNFAYTEVVRKKDERAKLTGCIQEKCCGKAFRLQAQAMRPQTSALDVHALLEKYLGDEAWKLSTMSKAEKDDMWVEAKMRELSNEHSKHRHRYHRAPSPPGFWRIAFPTTQEELEDNEEAARMERQMVEERYHEAMRPGGRWLFKDE